MNINDYDWRSVSVFMALLAIAALFWFGVFCLTRDVLGSEVSLGATVPWNCENMKTSPHPIPVSIDTDDNGNWDVFLEDGSIVTGIRYDGYMKWVWEDAWWHTNGVDVVYCESDVKALSILMSK